MFMQDRRQGWGICPVHEVQRKDQAEYGSHLTVAPKDWNPDRPQAGGGFALRNPEALAFDLG